jgi:iron(III) transport system permease protein
MTERLTLSLAVLLLALIGLLPIASLIGQTFVDDGGFSLNAYRALLAPGNKLGTLIGHSLLLSLVTASLSIFIGVPLGILLGKSNLPLRGILALAFTVPLLFPPYVLAVAWFSIAGHEGLLGKHLPDAWSQTLSSTFFGLPGCILVLTSTLMPIAMLLTIAFLRVVNPQLENAGRLTAPWPRILCRITLPLIFPAIAFAAILTFLLSLGEIGVPMYLRYPVYSVETLTQFAAFYDFRAATTAAMPLLLVTMIVLALQTGVQRRALDLGRRTAGSGIITIPLGRWRLPLLVLVLVPALVLVAAPFFALIVQSSSLEAYREAFSRAGASILRSMSFAAAGATVLAVLGFFWGYLAERRPLPVWWVNEWLALFLFALPGSVIGIGLITLWNTKATGFIYATPLIVILGYVAQYAFLPMRAVSVSLGAVPKSLEDAARLSGAGWWMTLRFIVIPLARRGLVVAWLVAYVFALRDAAISIVVYPPGQDTLSVRIQTLMANGTPSLIAALCVILIIATVVPLGIAGFWLDARRK